MNKREIEELVPKAFRALQRYEIAENMIIKKTFRGQISSFGAAISLGGLRSAVAYFSAQGGSSVERQKLMNAIYHLVTENDPQDNDRDRALFDYVNAHMGNKDEEYQTKEKICNTAIALKLAMNLYTLDEA
jgi:CRISPR-associated protein Cmr5